ncbi:MAG TPA: MFS transporter [Kofleriaceae bacterium]
MNSNRRLDVAEKGFRLTFAVCAFGYVIDLFDTFLLNVLRVPSLRELGLGPDQVTAVGASLLQLQVFGIVLGSFVWGSLADLRGRKAAVMTSILLYSVASLACGWVETVSSYKVLRFVVGLGLGGEMGAAITLIIESAPQKKRGMYTAWIASMGAIGAVLAGVTADFLDWRTAYKLGGVVGFLLLFLRVRMIESPLFLKTKLRPSSILQSLGFFGSGDRVMRMGACILSALPIWFWLGVCVSFAPEIFKDRVGEISVSHVVTWNYLGFFVGELSSGWLAQSLGSRKKVLTGFLFALILLLTAGLLFPGQMPVGAFYAWVLLTGFASGYWVLFATIVAEQFATHYRGFATTTAPQILRFLAIPLIASFQGLKISSSAEGAARTILIGVAVLAGLAIFGVRETYRLSLEAHES